ncbi:MAG: hypothetical protein PHC89_00495 [Candidatus Pacebacteria bacterium]|nr:hypothetical protein [Candidatus Paceibacterota bacterium]
MWNLFQQFQKYRKAREVLETQPEDVAAGFLLSYVRSFLFAAGMILSFLGLAFLLIGYTQDIFFFRFFGYAFFFVLLLDIAFYLLIKKIIYRIVRSLKNSFMGNSQKIISHNSVIDVDLNNSESKSYGEREF